MAEESHPGGNQGGEVVRISDDHVAEIVGAYMDVSYASGKKMNSMTPDGLLIMAISGQVSQWIFDHFGASGLLINPSMDELARYAPLTHTTEMIIEEGWGDDHPPRKSRVFEQLRQFEALGYATHYT